MLNFKKTINLMVLSLLAVFLFVGCGQSASSKENIFRVGIIPNENHEEMLKINEPLKLYLEETLDMPVEIFVASDYVGVIEAMNAGQLDIAYYGPLTYVLAHEKTGAIPLVKAEVKGSATYHSIIIARKDSKIESVSELKGEVFAFGDPASTSSHLMPNAMLREEGIDPDKDLNKVFTGGHDAVAMAVLSGSAKAGGLNENNYLNLVRQGLIDEDEIEILLKSDPIPEYPWAARHDMSEEMVNQVIEAFVAIKDEEILAPQLASAFVPAKNEDYDVIRRLVHLLDIDLEEHIK